MTKNNRQYCNARNTYYLLINIFLSFSFTTCATYYQKHSDFNKDFERGDLKRALETLRKNEELAHSNSRFVYYVNNGLLLSILGRYEESNSYFEKAFLFGEDYHINYVQEAASYLTNPMVSMYRGEDHEHLMVLYFKAINYLKLEKHEQALVECRRLNIRLNQLSDKYLSEKKYQRDAFIHTLMGIIYQADKDYNNAFIAYRNAAEVYEQDYAGMFGLNAPDQLKKDLLNAAWWTGFMEEFEQYKEKFGMADYIPEKPVSELVFFWHNGLGPVKGEWSINFLLNYDNDMVIFSNESMAMSFPFRIEQERDKNDLSKLEFFRVAFPKYYTRPMYFQRATLMSDSIEYPLQLTEDINQIAFHSLQERMMLELGKGLLRAALKKATEHSLRKEDERLGAVIGMVNALTEKADTRNWQTIPHSIFYARVPLQEGKNDLTFSLQRENGERSDYQFSYQAKVGQTLFHTFSSLETMAAPYRYY